MSNRKRSKRWLYDSTIEVPKATKWRCRIKVNNPHNDKEIVDVHGHFVTEVIDLEAILHRLRSRKLLVIIYLAQEMKPILQKDVILEKNLILQMLHCKLEFKLNME